MKSIFLIFFILMNIQIFSPLSPLFADNINNIDFETCLSLVRSHPENTFYHYTLGKHFETTQNFAEALKEYQKCQELNPKPYYQSAVIRISNRLHLKESFKKLNAKNTRQYISHKINNPLIKQADLLYKSKKYSQAIALYQKILSKTPSGFLFVKLSRAYLRNDQPKEARKVLVIGKDFLYKHSTVTQELNGDISLRIGELSSALDFYQKALTDQNNKWEGKLWQKIAKTYRLQKDHQKARQAIRKSLTIRKTIWNLYEAGKIEECDLKRTKAIVFYKQALKLSTRPFEKKLIKHRLATCNFYESIRLYKEGDATSASAKLAKIIQDQSSDESLTQKAKFWKKQADFRITFNQALQNGKKLFQHNKDKNI